MRVEFFKPEIHYEMICKWWTSHKWPSIPLTHLPQLGLVSYASDVPGAAGFIYQTDSAFCLFEWIVANPEVRREERKTALNLLFEKAKTAAKELGFKTIFMTVTNESLIKRLTDNGFQISEKSMANVTYDLQGVG